MRVWRTLLSIGLVWFVVFPSEASAQTDYEVRRPPHGQKYAPPILLISAPPWSPKIFTFDDHGWAPTLVRNGWRVYTADTSLSLGERVRQVTTDAATPPVVIAYGTAGTWLYASVANGDDVDMRAVVTVGAAWQHRAPSDSLRGAKDFAPGGTLEFAPVPSPLPRPKYRLGAVLEVLYAGAGIDHARALLVADVAVIPMSRESAVSLRSWINSGQPRADGPLQISAPVLVLAGSLDVFAPPESVFAVRSTLKAKSTRYMKVGRSNFDETDYSHLALAAGDHASKEVVGLILEWLEDEVVRK